jgi:hypothetical protein
VLRLRIPIAGPRVGLQNLRLEGQMSDRLSLSIFTIEVDGKPTLAFEAKRYSEAEAVCGDEGLRARLIY